MRRTTLLAFLPLLAASALGLAPLAARAEEAPAAPDVDETRGYAGWSPGFVQGLEEKERVERGYSKPHGMGVMAVLPGGPAEQAGLRVGDIVLSLNGVAIPDTSHIGKEDGEKASAFLKEHLTPITHKVRPGDTVVFVVDRGGKTVTVEAVAIDKAAQDALRDAAQEEELAVKVPPPGEAGAPAPFSADFQKLPEGESRPPEFLSVTGLWEVRGAQDDAAQQVLLQDSDMGDQVAVCLVVGPGRACADATVKVRWLPMGGESSVSGGVIVRARARHTYLAVRADGVSRTLRVYAVRAGKAEVLAEAALGSPKLNAWHPIEVLCEGSTLRASVDGKTKVEAGVPEDFASGWTGLATWGDSVAAFDDFAVTPAAAPAK